MSPVGQAENAITRREASGDTNHITPPLIAAISISCILGIALLFAAVVFLVCVCRNRRRRLQQTSESSVRFWPVGVGVWVERQGSEAPNWGKNRRKDRPNCPREFPWIGNSGREKLEDSGKSPTSFKFRWRRVDDETNDVEAGRRPHSGAFTDRTLGSAQQADALELARNSWASRMPSIASLRQRWRRAALAIRNPTPTPSPSIAEYTEIVDEKQDLPRPASAKHAKHPSTEKVIPKIIPFPPARVVSEPHSETCIRIKRGGSPEREQKEPGAQSKRSSLLRKSFLSANTDSAVSNAATRGSVGY